MAAVATAAVLAPAVAFAAFSAATSNPGNAVTAGVLSAPGDLIATAHPTDSAANSGEVTLTWSDTRSGSGTVEPTGYLVERRPAGSTEWTTVATPTRAAVCTAGTCGYTDATAAFNATYSYRVRSTVGSWTAGPSDVRLAASVAPGAAEGRGPITSGLTSVAQHPSGGLIAVGQGGRIVVCASGCTGGGATWQTTSSPTVNDLNRVVVESSGQAWAVGDGGTILKCAANCATATGSWAQVTTPSGTADLYGVFTTNGYMAVVGANRTMLYATNNNGTGWQAAATSGIGATTTFYGIAGKNSKDVVVVGGTGSAGVIAACPNGGGVCGSSLTLTAVTSYSGGSPAKDLRDIAYVAGGGDTIYAVGLGGQVYVSTSTAPTSTYTRKGAGTTADLYAVVATSQNSGAAVGTPDVSGNSVFVRCTSSCTGSGTWGPPAGVDTGTTNDLRGLAGTGGAYWAVGASGTIRHFTGGSWTAQSPPSAVVAVAPTVVATRDGSRATVGTGTLSATCAGAALVATAAVPARSSATVTVPTVRVTVGYAYAGSSNGGQVLLSTTNGATWSDPRTLTSNVSTTTVTTVDLTGTVAASDSVQEIKLCVQGSGGGGTMFVDLVHVDVEE